MNTFLKAIALIRLGYQHKKDFIKLPYSKWTLIFIDILYKHGYLSQYSRHKSRIVIQLKYFHNNPCLTHIKIYSKPSHRIYINKKQVCNMNPFNGLGFCLLSTNKGILTHSQAQQLGVGGELLVSFF